MKQESLTAKQVEHMKPGDKRTEVPAGPPAGLYLVVHPTGRKGWALRYRYHGRPRNLTFPKGYPDMTLAAARAEAESLLGELDKGNDPALLQRHEKEVEALQQASVANVVEEWLKREVRPGADGRIQQKAWKETQRIIEKETHPWRTRDISDIKKPDVLRLLDGIVDRGASVMACRTRGVLLRFFKWAKKRGYIEQSPMFDVSKPGADHKDRDRVLEPAELAEVWNASNSLSYPVGPFIRLLILTAQRRGEVARMRWRDVDLDKALWTLPAEVTKNGRIHYVPLSRAALTILGELPRFTGDYVFTYSSGEKPVNSFSDMKEALDGETLKRRKERGAEKNIEKWTMHDLRRTAATLMAGRGVLPHVLTAILNQTADVQASKSSPILKVYQRYQYLDEKRAALEAWADYVVSLTDQKQKAATA